MGIHAYITGDRVKLYFDREEQSLTSEFDYKLGEQLLNFIWLPIDKIILLYNELVGLYTKDFTADSTIDEIVNSELFAIKEGEVADKIDNYCCYLHFYTQKLLLFFYAYTELKDDKVAMRDIIDRFISGELGHIKDAVKISSSYANEDDLIIRSLLSKMFNLCMGKHSFEVQKKVFNLAVQLIVISIVSIRNMINDELDLMMNEENIPEGLSPLQKLCYHDLKRPNPYYIDRNFNTVLKQYPKVYSDSYDEDNIEEIDSIVNNESTIVPMYPIELLDDLITLETYRLFANETIIRKCKYCGHYFIPENRSDSDYCNRIKEDETKPCNVVGPKRIYDLKKKNDPITKAHHKAYNRMRAKLRRESITQTEFCNWSDMATKKREECKEGKIIFDKYQEWLDKDKIQ